MYFTPRLGMSYDSYCAILLWLNEKSPVVRIGNKHTLFSFDPTSVLCETVSFAVAGTALLKTVLDQSCSRPALPDSIFWNLPGRWTSVAWRLRCSAADISKKKCSCNYNLYWQIVQVLSIPNMNAIKFVWFPFAVILLNIQDDVIYSKLTKKLAFSQYWMLCVLPSCSRNATESVYICKTYSDSSHSCGMTCAEASGRRSVTYSSRNKLNPIGGFSESVSWRAKGDSSRSSRALSLPWVRRREPPKSPRAVSFSRAVLNGMTTNWNSWTSYYWVFDCKL